MAKRLALLVISLASILCPRSGASAHDIPNERVDRLLQARIEPGRLILEYEVSLSEFTVLLDLRRLDESRESVQRGEELWDRYGRLIAPLNAAGILVQVDDQDLALEVDSINWRVEDHLIYTFTFSTPLPTSGRLTVRDTNYLSSPGTGRLGATVEAGLIPLSELPPPDAHQLDPVPRWMMSDDEERQTREFQLDYQAEEPGTTAQAKPVRVNSASPSESIPSATPVASGISHLDFARQLPELATSTPGAWLLSWLFAILLGAGHALQPGHGKLIIASTTAPGTSSRYQPFLLAALASLTHLSSVLALALLLWASRGWRFESLDHTLKLAAGSMLAMLGAYRLGRVLGGSARPSIPREEVVELPNQSTGWWLAGIAAGLIPCWDAVLLVLITEARGHLPLGLWLLTGFSLGLLLVQFGIASVAQKLGPRLELQAGSNRLSRGIRLVTAVALAGIGLFLMIG